MTRVSTYQGTPKVPPCTWVDFTAEGKNSLVSMDFGVGAKAVAKSLIQVVPMWAMSGVVPPAIAVWYLL